ncbi:MAG: 2-dehydropantoate 2-reductase [Lachnospiraceae bacterium]|nr:2-dehydropantoate 2-reductase [Lachnospiraceae bacterium]
MKVLVIGAGALGIGIGASLKNGGAEVDFFARGTTKEIIEKEGIVRKGLFGDTSFPGGSVGCFDDYNVLPKDAYDYVIIATKTTANEEVAAKLASVKDALKEDAKIVFMQNGIGYEKPFLEFFEEKALYHSRVITGFYKVQGSNVSEVTVHQSPVLIGSIYGMSAEDVKPLVDILELGGVPARPVMAAELSEALWSKFIYNTTLNPLGAILGKTYGQLGDSEYARSIMDILIEESFAVMKSCGAKCFWNSADTYRKALYGVLIPETYDHQSSTLQDIQNKRKTEIDFITGSLLKIASVNNVDVTMHTFIYTLIKALEEGF